MIEIEKEKFNDDNDIKNNIKYIKLKNEINELHSENNQIINKKFKIKKEINYLNKIIKDLEKNNLILKKEIADLKQIIKETDDSKNYLISKIESESIIITDLRNINLTLKNERDELINNKIIL